jgi:hypothetical protein
MKKETVPGSVADKIKKLVKTYNNEVIYKRDYLKISYESMIDIIRSTYSGSKVCDCYEDAIDYRIIGERVYSTNETTGAWFYFWYQAKNKEQEKLLLLRRRQFSYSVPENLLQPEDKERYSHLIYRKDYGKSKTDRVLRYRVIEINNELHPVMALTALVHEMQHGCISIKRMDMNDKMMSEPDKDWRGEHDRLRLIDEMKAYRVMLDFYTEIATEMPDYIKRLTGLHVSSGNILIDMQYFISTEDYLEKGKLAEIAGWTYSDSKNMDRDKLFYEHSDILREELHTDFRMLNGNGW